MPPTDGEVAHETLDGVNIDGLIELAPIASAFTRMIADPAHDRWQRVVRHHGFPRLAVIARRRRCQPAPDVMARRALGIAERLETEIVRLQTAGAAGKRTLGLQFGVGTVGGAHDEVPQLKHCRAGMRIFYCVDCRERAGPQCTMRRRPAL